jgi:hypothetical protein
MVGRVLGNPHVIFADLFEGERASMAWLLLMGTEKVFKKIAKVPKEEWRN